MSASRSAIKKILFMNQMYDRFATQVKKTANLYNLLQKVESDC